MLAISLLLLTGFDFANAGLQFLERREWIPAFDIQYHLGAAAPILSQGDLMGSVLLLLSEGDSPLQEADQGLAKTVAGFLGKQMES